MFTEMLDNVPKILILDFGSQYTQLICRRLRELGIYSEIQAYTNNNIPQNLHGIILSGGPASAVQDVLIPEWVWKLQLPVLGICYGMQAMANKFGGCVVSGGAREFGLAYLQVKKPVVMPVVDQAKVWMSHGDHVLNVGPEFEVWAENESKVAVAMAHKSKPYYGVQFHPEVTNTENGSKLLEWFASQICQCPNSWQQSDIAQNLINTIKTNVGDEKVLLAVSGGVDSTVVAMLLQAAIADKFHAVFVDNGLLRKDEVEQVKAMFFAANVSLSVIDAKDKFYNALKGITEPEQKRKLIGKLFIDIFQEFSQNKSDCKWLAQGTIYPDIIESAGKNKLQAEVIKSHHNVGGLPDDLQFKLLEPIACLFKDEVRALGAYLKVPHKMLYRHPFPGPGLAVRIIGEVTQERVAILQKADAIFMEAISDIYHDLSQAFAVLLTTKTVGVVGDQRTYGYVLALRAVVTSDFMTAESANIPFSILNNAARKIVNAVPEVARVVYDITDKPPSTIEWE